MNKPKWLFPETSGGVAGGWNDSSIDHFKGHRLSSLVREVIQNSIDARVDKNRPVVVSFQFESIPLSSTPELGDLVEHIKLARETARMQKANQAVDFYNKAEASLLSSKTLRFLSIHDNNTSGLTGPIDEPYGAWWALVKGSGLTQKPGPALGSFGHGSKAPFVSSCLRTLFYLTVIEDANKQKQVRFQGKSILQSHKSPSGKMTQGTGFFGHETECTPLVNAEVPSWALSLRTKLTSDCGTSVIIPGSLWNEESVDSIVITAIANFFYAIWADVLEVNIGDIQSLSSKNIVEKFKTYSGRLEEPFDEIDRESVVDAFQTIETIVNPTEKGEQQLPAFGRIDWYFRVGEDVDARNVAVARGNGMLITKRAPQLIKFPNLKPFDFFVCVIGHDGSELLRSIENPEHTNFEFDRLDDESQRVQAKRKYDSFQKAIREILKRLAGYSSADQVIIDDLQELFHDISQNVDSPGGNIERGNKIQIASGGWTFKQKPEPQPELIPGTNEPDTVPGRGHKSGQNKQKSRGGSIPSPSGKGEVIGPTSAGDKSDETRRVVKLRNLRMRASPDNENEIVIFFEAPFSGRASLKLLKVGELSNETLDVVVSGKKTDEVEVTLEKDKRTSLAFTLTDSGVDFAIEGEAYEIKS